MAGRLRPVHGPESGQRHEELGGVGQALPSARQEGPCRLCRRKRGRDRVLEVRAVQVCGPVAGGESLRQQKGRADFG